MAEPDIIPDAGNPEGGGPGVRQAELLLPLGLGYDASTRPRAAKHRPSLPKSSVRHCQRDPKGPPKYPEVYPNHPEKPRCKRRIPGKHCRNKDVRALPWSHAAERRAVKSREENERLLCRSRQTVSRSTHPEPSGDATLDGGRRGTPVPQVPTSRRQRMDCADLTYPSQASVGQLENNRSWQQGARSPSLWNPIVTP